MLAIIFGDVALFLGLLVLLLPLLVTELSRPRDSFLGAAMLFLGLLLVTNNDRFLGSPMLAVSVAALVIGRLGLEVFVSRWQQLSDIEKSRLTSFERWITSFNQFGSVLIKLFQMIGGMRKTLQIQSESDSPRKKWVRKDPNEIKDASISLEKKIKNSSSEEAYKDEKNIKTP